MIINSQNRGNAPKGSIGACLLQESLIEKTPTLKSLMQLEGVEIGRHIFIGTGISRPGEMASELPLDFLVYPLIARRIQEVIGGCHIHHLVADAHATLNQFNLRDAIRTGTSFRRKYEHVADRLAIENYHVYLSSEITIDNKYQQLYQHAVTAEFTNEYARREAVDIRYFVETRGIGLKLGWTFKQRGKLDEQVFDQAYQQVFGKDILNIYTASGKKFEDGPNEAVPYTITGNDKDIRLILTPTEDIVFKVGLQDCGDQTMNAIHNHYRAVVRLYEKVIGRLPEGFKNVWEKLNYINQFITN